MRRCVPQLWVPSSSSSRIIEKDPLDLKRRCFTLACASTCASISRSISSSSTSGLITKLVVNTNKGHIISNPLVSTNPFSPFYSPVRSYLNSSRHLLDKDTDTGRKDDKKDVESRKKSKKVKEKKKSRKKKGNMKGNIAKGDQTDMFVTQNNEDHFKRTVTPGLLPDGISVRPLTSLQYRQYALQCAVPMLGFGFMDNLIMITIGDLIDAHFSAFLSTLTAAAFGQCCSDVCGTSFGGIVDVAASKMGLPDARVTPLQADLFPVRVVRVSSMAIGVICGCIIGMFPLCFIDTKRNERIKKSKELRTLFKSVAEEGQRALNVERCSLYIDADGDGFTMWALAKKWTPSQAQLDDCCARSAVAGTEELSVELLNSSFDLIKFQKSRLPTDKKYINRDELPGLLKKMLGFGEKLEKKKIKKNGTKYIVMKDPRFVTGVLNIRDVYEDPRFSKSRKYSTESRTASEEAWRAHSVLIGPVLRDGKVVGCIEMINKKSLPDLEGGCVPFTRNDEKLVKLLCNHCSIFLNQLESDESISEILTAQDYEG